MGKFAKIKKLADAMYYAAQHLTTDASRLHKAMEEYHQFVINEYHNEEPVSKDLELTWEDIRDIYALAYNLMFPHKKQKEFYEECLIEQGLALEAPQGMYCVK